LAIDEFPYIPFRKIHEIVVALVERNQISAWAMRKSDFFLLVQQQFHKFFELVNSYRNTISKWAVIFRYENPQKNLASLGLIFEDFSTLGMKKFPYLKTGPFGNPILTRTELVNH
jgi:hypothetical protein